jgi:hypothetical protein
MQDKGRDASRHDADDVSDGRWLTYAELAKLRGIDRASAFKLALRHKWSRQKNNKGQVTVLVPPDFTSPEDESQDNGYDASYRASFDAALAAVRDAHAGEVAALRSQMAAARAEADTSRDRADRTLVQLAEAHSERAATLARAERAEVLVANLEAAIATKEEVAAQARSEAEKARQATEALRQVEIDRRGKGRWARLRAAWRGD